MNCANCHDLGWVCENHIRKPWNAAGCECGAGAPCPACNAPPAEFDREALNRLKLFPLDPGPNGEIGHFYECNGCGQWVDQRRLGDVLHHDQECHEPLPLN